MTQAIYEQRQKLNMQLASANALLVALNCKFYKPCISLFYHRENIALPVDGVLLKVLVTETKLGLEDQLTMLPFTDWQPPPKELDFLNTYNLNVKGNPLEK